MRLPFVATSQRGVQLQFELPVFSLQFVIRRAFENGIVACVTTCQQVLLSLTHDSLYVFHFVCCGSHIIFQYNYWGWGDETEPSLVVSTAHHNRQSIT